MEALRQHHCFSCALGGYRCTHGTGLKNGEPISIMASLSSSLCDPPPLYWNVPPSIPTAQPALRAASLKMQDHRDQSGSILLAPPAVISSGKHKVKQTDPFSLDIIYSSNKHVSSAEEVSPCYFQTSVPDVRVIIILFS